jgi:hypothetical protein
VSLKWEGGERREAQGGSVPLGGLRPLCNEVSGLQTIPGIDPLAGYAVESWGYVSFDF